jgi:hypothetical protein
LTGFRILPQPTPENIFTRAIWNVVNGIMRGKTNNTGTVTLAANAATTTVLDPRIDGQTVMLLQATTANAAAEMGNGTIFWSVPTAGSVVINHANNAQVDRTFLFALIG